MPNQSARRISNTPGGQPNASPPGLTKARRSARAPAGDQSTLQPAPRVDDPAQSQSTVVRRWANGQPTSEAGNLGPLPNLGFPARRALVFAETRSENSLATECSRPPQLGVAPIEPNHRPPRRHRSLCKRGFIRAHLSGGLAPRLAALRRSLEHLECARTSDGLVAQPSAARVRHIPGECCLCWWALRGSNPRPPPCKGAHGGRDSPGHSLDICSDLR